MKQNKKLESESSIKQALFGLYGIVGVALSTFGPFKVPFAESHAKEYWRHALAGIFLVLLMIAGIISFAAYLFDANYFKSQMVDYVKTHNQRDLTLEGDIKVTFFPKLGLDSGKMTLSQRNSSKGFASIENARFYIAWLPLLRKQFQIDSVSLDGVHANLIRYKDASTNLDDLFLIESGFGDIKFEIDSIKLKNSSANLQDETSDILLSLHDVNIETGKLTDTTPADVRASFRLESAKPRIDGKVKLNSHVLFDIKAGHYEFANFEGEMEVEAAGASNLSINLQGNLAFYPSQEHLLLEKFNASVKGKLENRKAEAKLSIPKLEINKNKTSGNTISFNTTLLQEEENLSATLELPTFEIIERNLKAENLNANFDLFKAGSTLQGKLNGPLQIDFGLKQIQLPSITGNFIGTHPLLSSKLGANLSGNMQASLADQNARLEFNAKIDDSNFTGSLALQDFSHPVYSFDLGANKLDLDRYIGASWDKRMQDEALPFDFSALKDLNLRGKLRCNELKFAKLKTGSVVADIRIDQSTLLLEPLSALLYGGTTSGSLSISANETPRIMFKQKLANVQINTLLADLFPGEAKLAGKGNLSLDLTSTGENIATMRKSLNGSFSLSLAQGSLSGINLTEALLDGKSQLGMKDGERSHAAKFAETTTFSELRATFDIIEGNVRSNDFLLKSPLFSSKGDGEIALESGQLNYRLNTTVAAGLSRKNNGDLAELKGINIPMRVTGPYATPSIIIDFSAATGGAMEKSGKVNPLKAAIPPAPALGPSGK